MLIDGQWLSEDGVHRMRLGPIFLAEVRQGPDGRWVAVLNTKPVADTLDLEFAKGRVEWEIVTAMSSLSAAYRVLKARAPTSSDLFPFGAWDRWKARRQLG